MTNYPNIKRSIALDGHKTSVSLEEPFWIEVQRMAKVAGLPISEFVEGIDAARKDVNLSSALRQAVLADLQATIKAVPPMQQAAE